MLKPWEISIYITFISTISDMRTCNIWGEPHTITYDNYWNTWPDSIHFQGLCRTLASGTKATSAMIPFHVYTENEHRYGQTHVAYTYKVFIEWQGFTINFNKGGNVLVSISAIYLSLIPSFTLLTSLCSQERI